MNDAEDRCVGANAESEREDGDESEDRTVAEHAKTETHVLQQVVDVTDAASVAAIFFG